MTVAFAEGFTHSWTSTRETECTVCRQEYVYEGSHSCEYYPSNICEERLISLHLVPVRFRTLRRRISRSVFGMRYVILDFETTGVGKDASNGHRPHPPERMPLPRINYPTELCAVAVDETGAEIGRVHVLLRGARRMDPWVVEHCPHLTVERCETEGVSFAECVVALAALVEPGETTMVAHNVKYDWEEVLTVTAKEQEVWDGPHMQTLRACPWLDTMVNEYTRTHPVAGRKAFFFKRIGTWIGPCLADLAAHFDVAYDPVRAHDAAYDVDVTRRCLMRLRPSLRAAVVG